MVFCVQTRSALELVCATILREINEVKKLSAAPDFEWYTQSNTNRCPKYNIVETFSYEYQIHLWYDKCMVPKDKRYSCFYLIPFIFSHYTIRCFFLRSKQDPSEQYLCSGVIYDPHWRYGQS
ncbi:hypothetical protein HZS_8178 [Henneguya salminicola]|nr:hypothetical protein HZS_8178 [Henneguya salminicola]